VLYEAVRDNLATLLAETSEVGLGLPRYVERDFAKYLECGVLTHGFAGTALGACKAAPSAGARATRMVLSEPQAPTARLGGGIRSREKTVQVVAFGGRSNRPRTKSSPGASGSPRP
jgi:hypothetical protein